MKITSIILLLTSISYITSLIAINDISLSSEFVVNTEQYPNNILPINSILYFRMEVADLTHKLIEIRAEEKDSFIVKIALFEEKPEIKDEIEWTELELQQTIYDFTYYINLYNLLLKENINYILISITLKKDLSYLSLCIENDIRDSVVSYKSKLFTEYQVNSLDSQTKKVIIKLTENHIGENFLNLVVQKKDTPLNFNIYAFEVKKKEEDYNNKEKYIENFIDIKYNDTIAKPESDIYRYKFDLNDNSNNVFISVELDKKIDFSFYIDYPQKEKEIPVYNIDYSKELEIDLKNWVPSKNDYFILKSKEKHFGDTYINLKVKKGVTVDYFYMIGYGTKEYNTSNEENSEDLNIIYVKTIYKDSYDIIQYYFESKENTPYFTIKVYIYKNIDSLSFSSNDPLEDLKMFFYVLMFIVAGIIFICLVCSSLCNGVHIRF